MPPNCCRSFSCCKHDWAWQADALKLPHGLSSLACSSCPVSNTDAGARGAIRSTTYPTTAAPAPHQRPVCFCRVLKLHHCLLGALVLADWLHMHTAGLHLVALQGSRGRHAQRGPVTQCQPSACLPASAHMLQLEPHQLAAARVGVCKASGRCCCKARGRCCCKASGRCCSKESRVRCCMESRGCRCPGSASRPAQHSVLHAPGRRPAPPAAPPVWAGP